MKMVWFISQAVLKHMYSVVDRSLVILSKNEIFAGSSFSTVTDVKAHKFKMSSKDYVLIFEQLTKNISLWITDDQ